MAVKMRLTRMGDKKSPFYRIVVSDSRQSRDGKYIEQIGYFNPVATPEVVKIDKEKAEKWLKNGAELTDTVKALLVKNGVAMPEKKVKAKPAKKVEAAEKAEAKPTAKKTTAKKSTAKATK